LGNVVGKDGPHKTFGLKFYEVQKEELQKPGPGAYEPKINYAIRSSPNYRIGTSIREKYYL
jgi:hypothetical protein